MLKFRLITSPYACTPKVDGSEDLSHSMPHCYLFGAHLGFLVSGRLGLPRLRLLLMSSRLFCDLLPLSSIASISMIL
jgi:hypothetical protein